MERSETEYPRKYGQKEKKCKDNFRWRGYLVDLIDTVDNPGCRVKTNSFCDPGIGGNSSLIVSRFTRPNPSVPVTPGTGRIQSPVNFLDQLYITKV